MKQLVAILVTLAAAIAGAAPASAQFPEKGKAITIIVPYTPGGGVDFVARTLAAGMEKDLGTPVQVVNKPGAGAQIGLTDLVRSKPDGYTLALVVMPTVLTHYFDKTRNAIYDRTSFQPVAMLYSVSYAVAVRKDSPYRDFKSFIDAAKAKPDTIKIADAGLMTAPHVMLGLMERATGTRFASVHFNGGAPGIAALLGGHVDGMSGGGSDFVPQLKSGELRLLAVTTEGEDPLMPGVPTMKSLGYNVLFATATGIAAPKGTPPDVVKVLETSIAKLAATEEYKKALLGGGITPTFTGAREYEQFWVKYDEDVGPVVKALLQ